MNKNNTIADIFRTTSSTGEFREALRSFRGNFALGPDDILALGAAYLERFPGCDGNEDCDDVRDAYAVTKTAIIEYILAGVDDSLVENLRRAFSAVGEIEGAMDEIRIAAGGTGLLQVLGTMEGRTEKLLDAQKTVPPCIAKERFSGGIAYVMNAQYLMKLHAGIA